MVGGGKTIRLRITGMVCAGCVSAVRSALESTEGVAGATVDLDSGEAAVKLETADINVNDLILTVKTAGYDARIAD